MNPNPLPTRNRVDDMQALRGSTLGQLRYGELPEQVQHPVMKFFVKMSFVTNIGGFAVLFIMFRFINLFPPSDAPFMNAIGFYFFFGFIYAVFAFMVFNFAKFTEHQAVSRSLSTNRRYEWHSHYNTDLSEEELKKMPQVHHPAAGQVVQPESVGAGKKYFKIAKFLILASLITFAIGAVAGFNFVMGLLAP